MRQMMPITHINGFDMHYHAIGQGPALVFVHGL